ncbi:MAG: RagB/SusD family nutrient uptake outer membrane protein [Bacteroidaceae bacterium]|nr:RagB/SusD family nutrient uptake outer membrane protein [Bacteroidaceae bacterium]
MKLNIKNIIMGGAIALAIGLTSCVDDLNVEPINPQVSQEFDQQAVFTKIYASLGMTGMTGTAGGGDLDAMGIDEGQSGFYRTLWYLNNLAGDEAICNWMTDQGVPEANYAGWTDTDVFVQGLYYRLYFGVTLCNHFLDMTSDATDEETLLQRAEARFIRALNYYYLMDMYANVPLVTKVESELPQQAKRADIFAFLEQELLEMQNDMSEPGAGLYYRVDRAAAWTLLARLYLNAEVYTGNARWADAATYAEKVINSSYKLAESYPALFMGDNGENADAMQEIILPIAQHGDYTKTYSGSYFLVAATHTAGMPEWGTIDGWGGIRPRKSLAEKFNAGSDDRALFFKWNEDPSIILPDKFINPKGDGIEGGGWAVTKWNNLSAKDSDLANGILVPVASNDPEVKVPETDIPFLRAAEAYLTYAEAKFRLGEDGEAIAKFNALRTRANAQTVSNLTLDLLRDEWSREFYFEGRRRIDLIRFNSFGGNTDYKWDWKGSVANGTAFDAKYNILPIPAGDINANSNLTQNSGY